MNLEELLEHIGTYLDDRHDLVDGDPDELWSDALIVRFLNQGQRIHARRAWSIIDESHTTAGVIVLKTGVAVYPLHRSVLRVLMATPSDQDWPLGRSSDAILRLAQPKFDAPYDLNGASVETGRPLAFATDAATRTMRIFRTPTSTENGLKVNLKVARLPVEWLDIGNTDGEPEIPDEYHLDLADYACGRCLTQPTVDGQGKTDGRELLTNFNAAVMEARRDRQRAEMEPGPWVFASSTAVLDG